MHALHNSPFRATVEKHDVNKNICHPIIYSLCDVTIYIISQSVSIYWYLGAAFRFIILSDIIFDNLILLHWENDFEYGWHRRQYYVNTKLIRSEWIADVNKSCRPDPRVRSAISITIALPITIPRNIGVNVFRIDITESY